MSSAVVAASDQEQPPTLQLASSVLSSPTPTSPTTYIKTTTHSYVSRGATLDSPKCVELKGRIVVHDGARLRGDRAPIRIGRYSWLDRNCLIEPPPHPQPSGSTVKYIPVTIGAHTVIGAGSTIYAAAIGSLCWVGRHVQIRSRALIKDCCVVADFTVVPADAVVPPFHRAYTAPDGRFCTTPLPPAVAVELQERAVRLYHDFVAAQKQQQQQQQHI